MNSGKTAVLLLRFFYFKEEFFMTWQQAVIRLLLAVLLGGLIGAERGHHGRSAGMRTHILVCLGSAMTSMTGLYVSELLQTNGDVMRLAAQVISGIGFLGAGMIVLKNGSVVKGLTTAAGVWATATIGIALGYGFYLAAGVATALVVLSVTFLSLFEKSKRRNVTLYAELEEMSKLNKTLDQIMAAFPVKPHYDVVAPKSGKQGNVGLIISTDKSYGIDHNEICKIENVLYVVED